MAGTTFASRLNEDGTLAVPPGAVETLGLHPGDELQVRIEVKTADDVVTNQDYYEEKIVELLAQARRLKPKPGKPVCDPNTAALGEILKEKYRKQGFNL